MPHCRDIVKKCGQPPTKWQQMKNFLTSSKFIGAVSLSAILAGVTSKKHNLMWIGVTGLTATAGTIYSNSKVTERALTDSVRRPCTTIFDTFRFKPHPLCAKMPREKPLIFYNNEPIRPLDPDDPWLKNIPYDNVPKPKCCEKPGICCPPLPTPNGPREPFKSETYGNIPKGPFKCPH